MLQYRNTPDRDTRLSPAQVIFGRPIRDFIPIHPGKYQPHSTWRETLINREEALRNRHMRAHERLSEHTRVLPPLVVGDTVRLQNLIGPHPNKWDKTGIVIEVRQFDQYVVKVDGSGRVTIRNRKHLRSYTPFSPRLPMATTREVRIPRSAPAKYLDGDSMERTPRIPAEETRPPPGISNSPSTPESRHSPPVLPRDDPTTPSVSASPTAPTPELQDGSDTRTVSPTGTSVQPAVPVPSPRDALRTDSPVPIEPGKATTSPPPPLAVPPQPSRRSARIRTRPTYLDDYVTQ